MFYVLKYVHLNSPNSPKICSNENLFSQGKLSLFYSEIVGCFVERRITFYCIHSSMPFACFHILYIYFSKRQLKIKLNLIWGLWDEPWWSLLVAALTVLSSSCASSPSAQGDNLSGAALDRIWPNCLTLAPWHPPLSSDVWWECHACCTEMPESFLCLAFGWWLFLLLFWLDFGQGLGAGEYVGIYFLQFSIFFCILINTWP